MLYKLSDFSLQMYIQHLLGLDLTRCLILRKTDTVSHVNVSPSPCTMDIREGLKRANCRNRELDTVPRYLQNDVGKLDLSYNNIQALQNSSFRRYTSIEILDLSRNNITLIEIGTFKNLDRLRNLRLGIQFLPAEYQ